MVEVMDGWCADTGLLILIGTRCIAPAAAALLDQFRGLSSAERFTFLSSLIGELRLNEALVVSSRISPRLKRDFLSDLPVELALHCVSFIDDARTLGRAMRVCKYWQALLQDESKWKDMHDRKLYRSHSPVQQCQVTTPTGGFAPTMHGLPSERRHAQLAQSSWRMPGLPQIRQLRIQPQTYREMFRDAYLTESNWLHGGRLLTKHSSMGEGVVTSLVLNDEFFVIGMGNSEIHVFDATTGHYRQSLLGHELGVWALVLVAPGKGPRRDPARMSSGGHSRANEDTDSNSRTSRRMPSSDVCGNVRGWGLKRTLIVSGGCDREVRVWDVASGECVWSMPGHSSTVRCLKVLEGRPVAISGSRDATLCVWDIDRGRLLRCLEGHEASVRCIEVAGNQVVSGSYDFTCRLWDVDTGQCLQVFEGHYQEIYAVAFDGERVLSGSIDSTVRVWDAASGECLAILQGHTSLVGQLQLSGDRLITGGSDGRVIVFDLTDYSCVHRICAHDNSVTCLQFDDRFIVSGGNDGRVKLWDLNTGAFIRELTQPCEVVWRIGFHNNRCAILCQRNGRTVLEVLGFRPQDDQIRPTISRNSNW